MLSRSGNVVGSRTVKPCVNCTVKLSSSVNGFRWSFELAAVTLRPRIVGLAPSPTLADEPLVELDTAGDGSERWWEEAEAAPGTRMRWKHLPSAQEEFEERLVAEPNEWIDFESELACDVVKEGGQATDDRDDGDESQRGRGRRSRAREWGSPPPPTVENDEPIRIIR